MAIPKPENTTTDALHRYLATVGTKDEILSAIHEEGGFLNPDLLAGLRRVDRLAPVLVRCGGGRFTCPAQDLDHFVRIIEASQGQDYVRDVSLVAGYNYQ